MPSGGSASGGRRSTLIGSAVKQRSRTRTASGTDNNYDLTIGGGVAVSTSGKHGNDSSSKAAATISGDAAATTDASSVSATPGQPQPPRIGSGRSLSEELLEEAVRDRSMSGNGSGNGGGSSPLDVLLQEKAQERDALSFIDSNMGATISLLHSKEQGGDNYNPQQMQGQGQGQEQEQVQVQGDKGTEHVRQQPPPSGLGSGNLNPNPNPNPTMTPPLPASNSSALPGARANAINGLSGNNNSNSMSKKAGRSSGGPALLSATRKGNGAAFASILHSASFGDLQLAAPVSTAAGSTAADTVAGQQHSGEGGGPYSAPNSPDRHHHHHHHHHQQQQQGVGVGAFSSTGDTATEPGALPLPSPPPSSSSYEEGKDAGDGNVSIDINGGGADPNNSGSGSEDDERYLRILASANRLLASGDIDQEEYSMLITSDYRYAPLFFPFLSFPFLSFPSSPSSPSHA
jgi:hypothetical protein